VLLHYGNEWLWLIAAGSRRGGGPQSPYGHVVALEKKILATVFSYKELVYCQQLRGHFVVNSCLVLCLVTGCDQTELLEQVARLGE
jgi:hypothetical protein